jgi:hypothetical protein
MRRDAEVVVSSDFNDVWGARSRAELAVIAQYTPYAAPIAISQQEEYITNRVEIEIIVVKSS